MDATERILCLASYEKGSEDFLRQCAEMGVGAHPVDAGKAPRRGLAARGTRGHGNDAPGADARTDSKTRFSWMARGRRFDRIVALDEFDTETAAQIREHTRVPGMRMTTAGCYRDKLAMRVIAHLLGFLVPEFCRVLNYDVSCATL